MKTEECSTQDFGSFIQKNIKTLAEGIKTSSSLPVGSARNNFNACFPSFSLKMKPYSDEVLNLISAVLTREGIKQSVTSGDNEEKIDLVVDGVNKILDRVRDNINVMNGTKVIPIPTESSTPKENTGIGSWNKNQNRLVFRRTNEMNTKIPRPSHKVIEKPQLKFENKIDNDDSPFEPSLQHKPNAVKPLAIYLERNIDGTERYCHPYVHELNSFGIPGCQLEKTEPVEPADINSGYVVFVNNEESLANMLNELGDEKELAIDLEHHQYRSFQGFTCLMQISTRTKDYIIDTIALRSKLHVLNQFFTDPKIVKVLHGASSDIIWLQKDLNLYIVNMFDTHEASTVLNFPKLSLAYLLKHYCGVNADKAYQVYDWRIRPLPDDAISYARGDTHYLLYIYDQLRNELIDNASGSDNLLLSVYYRSTELCKKRYEKTFDVNGHLALYKQSKQSFDGRQMYALKLLYQWRDKIAREQDESTGYVLPNHMLMQISEILPREMQGILACCNPVPPLVRQNLFKVHQLVTQARSQPIDLVSNQQDLESITANKRQSLSILRCPHDFSYHDDFRDNLVTLLNGNDTIKLHDEEPPLELSVFDDGNLPCQETNEHREQQPSLKRGIFVSPYERYKRTIEFELAQIGKRNATEKTKLEQQKVIPTDLEENVHIYSSKPKSEADCKKDELATVDETPSLDATLPTTSGTTKRKRNVPSDEKLIRKCLKYDDVISESVSKQSQNNEKDLCILEDHSELSKETNSSDPPKSKNKNKKNKSCKNSNNTNPSTAVESNFSPFDYTKANYEKFVSAGQKNLKALLNTKISFGTNKMNKNKKQKQRFQTQRKK